MSLPAELLREARTRYDASPELAERARGARFGGFAAGAAWMREALGGRGGGPVPGASRLGLTKYGLACLAAVPVAGGALLLNAPLLLRVPLLMVGAPVAFYLVESRFVFAFPLAIEGARHPLRASHALASACGGAARVTACVMRIAAEMLAGGLLGRGFLRSWCVGCLAVVVWYERARARTER